MKRILAVAVLAVTAPLPVSAQLDDKCGPTGLSACAECNCYWSSECGSNEYCSYSSGCTHVGKKDGTCTASGGSGGFTPGQFAVAAAALGLWLDAYQETTPDKGLPNAEIVNRIQTLDLSKEQQTRVRFAAFNVLDVVLGFDFAHPRGNCAVYDARCLGILRIQLDQEARPLLQAVREGLTQGLQNGDRAALGKAVSAYWEKYPKFHPHHTGRCYPHGHPEDPFRSVAQCQIDELTRILVDLLTPAGKGYSG